MKAVSVADQFNLKHGQRKARKYVRNGRDNAIELWRKKTPEQKQAHLDHMKARRAAAMNSPIIGWRLRRSPIHAASRRGVTLQRLQAMAASGRAHPAMWRYGVGDERAARKRWNLRHPSAALSGLTMELTPASYSRTAKGGAIYDKYAYKEAPIYDRVATAAENKARLDYLAARDLEAINSLAKAGYMTQEQATAAIQALH